MKFHVPDMSCGHCTAAIGKAVKAADPEAEIRTDLGAKTVTIASQRGQAALLAVLQEAGYPASPA